MEQAKNWMIDFEVGKARHEEALKRAEIAGRLQSLARDMEERSPLLIEVAAQHPDIALEPITQWIEKIRAIAEEARQTT